MTNRFKFRRDISTIWARVNPTLADGEPGVERDTGRFKIGNGTTPWNSLPYFTPGGTAQTPTGSIVEHVNAELPHPVYDEGPSFTLIYQNAKV